MAVTTGAHGPVDNLAAADAVADGLPAARRGDPRLAGSEPGRARRRVVGGDLAVGPALEDGAVGSPPIVPSTSSRRSPPSAGEHVRGLSAAATAAMTPAQASWSAIAQSRSTRKRPAEPPSTVTLNRSGGVAPVRSDAPVPPHALARSRVAATAAAALKSRGADDDDPPCDPSDRTGPPVEPRAAPPRAAARAEARPRVATCGASGVAHPATWGGATARAARCSPTRVSAS